MRAVEDPIARTARAELEELQRRSRRIGADASLVVHGGGNTSTKTVERSHLGRERAVLRIKGSGSDLRTVELSDFPGLYLDDLLVLRERQAMTDEEMVDHLARCMVEPDAKRPSIETLLHAFIPARHVDHVHADAIVSLTNHVDATRAVREALGPDVALVEYVRPGFELSRRVADLVDAEAIVLAHHGLVTWSDDPEESIGRTLEMVRRAEAYLKARRPRAEPPRRPALTAEEVRELLLRLRGRLAASARRVLVVDGETRAVTDRPDLDSVAEAGPATADHLLRIKPWPLVVRSAADVDSAIDRFRERYTAYYEACRHLAPPGTAMFEPQPAVILVPGLGTVAAGRTVSAARVVAEVARHTNQVAATVTDVFGKAGRLPDDDLFGIEYWPLELYKLTLAKPPAELAGRVYIVTGAASGIGRAIAADLAARGAQLVLGDRDEAGLESLLQEIRHGGAEAPVPSIGDITDEAASASLVNTAIESFGGLDGMVSNAGIAPAGAITELSAGQWSASMAVNATAHFLLTKHVLAALERQGLGGSLVYVATKNAFAPGAGMAAYSAAKAAEVQVARIAAMEGGRAGIRANVVNPDAIFEGSRLWSPEVRAQRAAEHGVPVDQLELFYAKRNLLGIQVKARHVAEAVAFLLSDRSEATTGCVLTVDGGVPGAFPR